MRINYNVTGEKRKSLVGAISKELNAPIKYLGAPTFAYEVGEYRIDKNGVLEGKDNFGLVVDLCGLYGFMVIGEEYDTPLPEATPCAKSDEIEGSLIIQIPRTHFTDNALENLKGLVESKADLIQKALGINTIPIILNEEVVTFPWFRGEYSAEDIKAYTHFVTALCEMARTLTRVNSNEKSVENEKYAFRCFLLRLGFIVPKYKMERKILLSKLSGSSAFKSQTAKNEEVNE